MIDAGHNIRAVTLLTADEYLAMQPMADTDGLSDSAFIRHLIKMEARRRAFVKVSDERRLSEMEEPAQVLRTRGMNERLPNSAPTQARHRARQGHAQDQSQQSPKVGNAHLLLDSNGRQTVSLERRAKGAIVIENREQRLANEAKLARLAGGVR